MKKPKKTKNNAVTLLEREAMIKSNLDKLIAGWGNPTSAQQVYIRNMKSQLEWKAI